MELSSPTELGSASQRQPGTLPLPVGVSSLVIRLPNAATGLNNFNRVQNVVAAISLMREALKDFSPLLVPAVYGWASADQGQGWILQEYMPGSLQDEALETMTLQDQIFILGQMAEVLGALQRFELPCTIKEYGGLNFDESGHIVSAEMTILHAGPFRKHAMLYTEMLRSQLLAADKNVVLKGWRPSGVRERLDHFIAQGIDRIIQSIDPERKVLVHGDFSTCHQICSTCTTSFTLAPRGGTIMQFDFYYSAIDMPCSSATNNLPFYPKTLRMTAILDFEWAHVASVADKFFRSFADIGGQFPGPYSKQPEQLALRRALLDGFSSPLPSSEPDFQWWEVTKAWDDELARKGVHRPRTIKGIAELSGLYWLFEQICPFFLCNETVIKQRTKEQLENDRRETEELLIKYLEERGF